MATKNRLTSALNDWRDLLVTFDGRNRQLFYRTLKTGDVDLDDKNIDKSALDSLLSENPVRVSQLYPKLFDGTKKSDEESDLSLALIDQIEGEIEEKTPHKLWAQKLKKFEAVYRKARENFDEKNIETCFIAEGFVSWTNLKPGPIPNAPLILHPVKIVPTARGNTDFQLQITGDPFFNHALTLFFQKEYGFELSNFEGLAEEIGLQAPATEALINKLSEKINGFNISRNYLLGNFSFQKYPMVMDMNRILDSGDFHNILSAIAGDNETIKFVSEIGTEEDLMSLSNMNPSLENLIFPADSTQHQAISAILGGKSVVIQGPPGSGKSQTIANLIAEAVAKNKTILFVAEKRAAIDAVVDRLGRKGLAGVVLDLHGDPDKKTIASDLLAVIKSHDFPPGLSNANTKTLQESKKALNDRWTWLKTNSNIASVTGEDMTNLQLLIELGELRSNLGHEKIALILPSLWNLDQMSATDRDLAAAELQKLRLYGYFEQSFHDLDLLDTFLTIKTHDDFTKFSSSMSFFSDALKSPFWRKCLKHLCNITDSEITEAKQIEKSIKALKNNIAADLILDMSNFARIRELEDSLLARRTFKSKRDLNFVTAFMQHRKMRKQLVPYIKDSWTGMDMMLLGIIQEQSDFLEVAIRNNVSAKSLEWVKSEISTVESHLEGLVKALAQCKKFLKNVDFEHSPNLDEFREQIDQFFNLMNLIERIPAIRESLAVLSPFQLSNILDTLIGENFVDSEFSDFWSYAWLTCNLEKSTKKISSFSFDSNQLDHQIKVFEELDSIHLNGNAGRILTKISTNFHSIPATDRALLVKESMKKAGHLPFRKLLQQIPESILKLKPVMAMSPLAVSQLLPCKLNMFDLVVFDEASQIKPHDAITSIYRGKQLVVAGDRFQLPPTEFGERSLEDDLADSESDEIVEESATIGMESILTTAVAVFNNNVKPLGLHYRSNDERLISWSNFNIYRKAGEALFTFPSRAISAEGALRYTYLPDVRIQSMQVPNDAEIAAVKEAVLAHIKSSPELTLGIIAFGMRHSVRLQDEFNILERENDVFYNWKMSWTEKQDQFFIKNIERVQGDERDSIIITPGYAPNLDGSVPLQFGTLNRQGGERRLNVAASRAKEYMHLITSMRSTDIEMQRTKSASIGLLRSYLEFMENGGRLTEPVIGYQTTTTPFEAEILDALTKRGLQIDCQVGDSGFKIDFAVRDKNTSEYLLAIEADGATYHSSQYARERDYMRQRILENRGWRFVRIWSTDWWRDPESQVRRVLSALDSIPDRQTATPSGSKTKDSKRPLTSTLDGDQEFELFRGILAKNPNGSESTILTEWMALLGKQRLSAKLNEKFWVYWDEARKSLGLK